jgi:hypothetical protein
MNRCSECGFELDDANYCGSCKKVATPTGVKPVVPELTIKVPGIANLFSIVGGIGLFLSILAIAVGMGTRDESTAAIIGAGSAISCLFFIALGKIIGDVSEIKQRYTYVNFPKGK